MNSESEPAFSLIKRQPFLFIRQNRMHYNSETVFGQAILLIIFKLRQQPWQCLLPPATTMDPLRTHRFSASYRNCCVAPHWQQEVKATFFLSSICVLNHFPPLLHIIKQDAVRIWYSRAHGGRNKGFADCCGSAHWWVTFLWSVASSVRFIPAGNIISYHVIAS